MAFDRGAIYRSDSLPGTLEQGQYSRKLALRLNNLDVDSTTREDTIYTIRTS